jgi:hypothetical protein
MTFEVDAKIFGGEHSQEAAFPLTSAQMTIGSASYFSRTSRWPYRHPRYPTGVIDTRISSPLSNHLDPELAAHMMRVKETAHWLEWQDWADPIL